MITMSSCDFTLPFSLQETKTFREKNPDHRCQIDSRLVIRASIQIRRSYGKPTTTYWM